MGIRFRKSKKIAPGVKVNIGKRGASVTLGSKGVHHTISTTGRKTTSIGIPGTGISYAKTSSGNSHQNNDTNSHITSSGMRLINCPNCGKEFPEGINKCPVCGFQFAGGNPRMSGGKKILIGVGVFFALAVIAVTAGIINGKSQGLSMDDMIVDAPEASESPAASPKNSDENEVSDEEAMDIAMEQLKEKVANAEPNTSDMVDKIALQARDDAKAINDDLANEAITYIRDTYPNYFTDNETMEQTMYYGYLLDYAYDDSNLRSSLGTDTYQVVKYVYRGVEAVEDTPTQENLRQIEKSLNELQ